MSQQVGSESSACKEYLLLLVRGSMRCLINIDNFTCQAFYQTQGVDKLRAGDDMVEKQASRLRNKQAG